MIGLRECKSLGANLSNANRFLLTEFQLNHVLCKNDPREAKNALESLPTDLGQAYRSIVDRINKIPENLDIAFRTLAWIFYSQRPMHIDELREALSIRPDDEELQEDGLIHPNCLIECCESLVVLDQSGIVRFAHFTVHEFLEKNYVTQLPSPIDIATCCLAYLSYDIFGKGPSVDDAELRSRLESHRLTNYAARYWGVFASGPGEDEPHCRNAILRLLESEAKLQAIHQIELRNGFQIGNSPLTDIWSPPLAPWTPLHAVSHHGLSTICGWLLREGRVPSPTEGTSVAVGSWQSVRFLTRKLLSVCDWLGWTESWVKRAQASSLGGIEGKNLVLNPLTERAIGLCRRIGQLRQHRTALGSYEWPQKCGRSFAP